MEVRYISTSKRPLGASKPTESKVAITSPAAAPWAVCSARASWNTCMPTTLLFSGPASGRSETCAAQAFGMTLKPEQHLTCQLRAC